LSILIWIGIAVAGAYVLLLVLGDMPVHYRNKPVSFIESMAGTLAAVPEGGVMHVKHAGTGRVLTWHKLADSGTEVQRAEFRFTSEEWRSGLVDPVSKALAGGGFKCSVARDVSVGYHLLVRAPVEGEVLTFAREIHHQFKSIIPALGWSLDDRFNFHVRGDWDPQLLARVNLPFWKYTVANHPYGWIRRMASKKVQLAERGRETANDRK
jgi:hypothetical protein